MIKLAVTGCQGRMGQRIVILAINDQDFKLHTLLEQPTHPNAGQTMNGIAISTSLDALKGSDVLIDFTAPGATVKNVNYCRQQGIKMVIGTTGLIPAQTEAIKDAAKDIPIVFSSNMSIGVNILFKTVEFVAKAAPETYTVNITEAHHIHKKDAPSGTAKTIAQIIETASNKKVENIESIREGEIVGDHEITFESDGDVITVKHHAKNRDILAKGALVAAKFLKDKRSGLFSMSDVLQLNA